MFEGLCGRVWDAPHYSLGLISALLEATLYSLSIIPPERKISTYLMN